MAKSDPVKPGMQEWTAPDGSRWRVRTYWEQIGGRAECTQVGLESVDVPGRPVTSVLWRSVPIAALIDADAEQQATAGPPAMQAQEGHLFARGRKLVGGDGQPLAPDEALAEVAALYRDAWRRKSRSPTKDVAAALSMSRSAAANRIRRARAAGLLPKTGQGKASADGAE